MFVFFLMDMRENMMADLYDFFLLDMRENWMMNDVCGAVKKKQRIMCYDVLNPMNMNVSDKSEFIEECNVLLLSSPIF